MPNIKSAKKRVEVSEKNRAVNRSYKTELATALKKYNAAVSKGDAELVKKLYPVTVSLIDESVTRGVIHKNKADRKKADVSSKYIAVATKAKKPAKAAEPKKEVATEEIKPEAEEKPAKKPATKTTKTATKTTKAATKTTKATTEERPKTTRAKKTTETK